MTLSIVDAVATIKRSVAECLTAESIHQACRQVGHTWRDRELGPAQTIWAFLLQVLHGNTACAHVVRLARLSCSAAAYCRERERGHSTFSMPRRPPTSRRVECPFSSLFLPWQEEHVQTSTSSPRQFWGLSLPKTVEPVAGLGKGTFSILFGTPFAHCGVSNLRSLVGVAPSVDSAHIAAYGRQEARQSERAGHHGTEVFSAVVAAV